MMMIISHTYIYIHVYVCIYSYIHMVHGCPWYDKIYYMKFLLYHTVYDIWLNDPPIALVGLVAQVTVPHRDASTQQRAATPFRRPPPVPLEGEGLEGLAEIFTNTELIAGSGYVYNIYIYISLSYDNIISWTHQHVVCMNWWNNMYLCEVVGVMESENLPSSRIFLTANDHLSGSWKTDTLWWTNILPWKITMFNGKIHYKWPFSIAMLVHQRVETANTLLRYPRVLAVPCSFFTPPSSKWVLFYFLVWGNHAEKCDEMWRTFF